MRVDEIAGRYEADLAGREVARRGFRAGCGWQRVDVVGHRGKTINSQQVGEASEPLGYDAGGGGGKPVVTRTGTGRAMG